MKIRSVRIHPIEIGYREIIGGIAENAELRSRGDEDYPPIGEITRMKVVRTVHIITASVLLDEFLFFLHGEC